MSAALIGQLVTVYAAGSLLAAIPLAIATRGWRRRPLLLVAIAGFVVVNTVTTLSTNYTLTLVARFFAGVSAGLVWALLFRLRGAHGARASARPGDRGGDDRRAGRIVARYSARGAGGCVDGLALYVRRDERADGRAARLGALAGARFRRSAGRAAHDIERRIASPGLKAVLAVMFAYVLAHTILYTYISPFLALAHLQQRVDAVLFVFGVMALVSIAIVGVLVDRHLRRLMLDQRRDVWRGDRDLGLASDLPAAVYASVGVWGPAFGGAATLFQTAPRVLRARVPTSRNR